MLFLLEDVFVGGGLGLNFGLFTDGRSGIEEFKRRDDLVEEFFLRERSFDSDQNIVVNNTKSNFVSGLNFKSFLIAKNCFGGFGVVSPGG